MIVDVPRPAHYTRIADDIRQQIATGRLKAGDRLPSMAEMMASYEVGSTAVRNALLVLRTEGLIEGQQGKGIYVADRGTG